MSLQIGQQFGSYEIRSLLGKGGMGEVYRARDTKLKRDVAIKILPDEFSRDADRVNRFQREAELLASLNHPNIAAIYDLQETNGSRYLVLELVEGETLADRIARGPIPVEEALDIATHICEALEAAHEKGVIHRDLKPANVKTTPESKVKVLDFGLAKGMEPVGTTPSASQSPTITSPAMTQAGIILGTAAYMSPEQAKGRDADKRSDVWSFGCVLYEMLTGKRAFDGEDVSDTLAAVLRGDPHWAALPRETPPSIVTLLKRCLERDRQRRIGDIAAAQFVLSEQVSPVEAVQPKRPRRNAVLLAATALIAVILGGVGAWILKPNIVTTPPLVRFNFSLGEGEQFTGTSRQVVTISPDGTEMVYAANNRLYRKSIHELESHVIPGTEAFGGNGTLSNPAFSPDGRSIVFHTSSDGTLKRIPLAGGSAATIVRSPNPTGMSWVERGIVLGRGSEGVVLVSPNSGSSEQLVKVESDELAYGPQILPGGDAVLFTLAKGLNSNRWDTAQIVVQSVKTQERKIIIEGGGDGRYLPSGHLLYAASGSLFAVGFDPATRMVSGERVPILAGVRRSVGFTTATAQFSVSNTGTLVYIPGPVDATATLRTLVVSDRMGATTSLKLPPHNYVHPRVSPDGTRLAVGIDDGQEANIWIYDLDETKAIRRLTLKGRNRYPVWSGDGLRIAFQSEREGDRGIFSQRADGVGEAERLTTALQGASHVPESWSRDGKHLLFTEQKELSYILHSLSIDTKTSAPFGNVKSAEPPGATFSPDGRWIAYASSERAGGGLSPNRGIFVQPFPATVAIYQVPKVRLDYHPVWTPDGKTLLYVPASPQSFVTVSVNTQPSITFGSPIALPQVVPRPSLISSDVRGYDILPDGRILAVIPAFDQDAAGGALRPEIRVVLNWFGELKRLVPVK